MPHRDRSPVPLTALGPLESRVMEALWATGGSNVHEVRARIPELAYTTLLTTVDRLFKKGLLERHKQGRAFVYVPRKSRAELAHQTARGLISGLLERGAEAAPLVSFLLETVSAREAHLLDALERAVREKRDALARERR